MDNRDINFQPLKHGYSPKLQDEAENFIVKCFTDNKLSTGVHPILVESAMNIINGMTFYQPIASGNVREVELENSVDATGCITDTQGLEYNNE